MLVIRRRPTSSATRGRVADILRKFQRASLEFPGLRKRYRETGEERVEDEKKIT